MQTQTKGIMITNQMDLGPKFISNRTYKGKSVGLRKTLLHASIPDLKQSLPRLGRCRRGEGEELERDFLFFFSLPSTRGE